MALADVNELLLALEADIGHAHMLFDLIEKEYAALQRHAVDDLERILADKQNLLGILDHDAKARTQYLLERGCSADHAGWKAYTTHLPEGQTLMARSQQLSEWISRCQQANVRNGKLIMAGQSSTRKLLEILRGQSGQPLYTPHGAPARAMGGWRMLGQA